MRSETPLSVVRQWIPDYGVRRVVVPTNAEMREASAGLRTSLIFLITNCPHRTIQVAVIESSIDRRIFWSIIDNSIYSIEIKK